MVYATLIFRSIFKKRNVMKLLSTNFIVFSFFLVSFPLIAQLDCVDFTASCNDARVLDPQFEGNYSFKPHPSILENHIQVSDAFNGNATNAWIPIIIDNSFSKGEIVSDIIVSLDLFSIAYEELEAFLHVPRKIEDLGFDSVIRLDSLNNMEMNNVYTASKAHDHSELENLVGEQTLEANLFRSDIQLAYYSETSGTALPYQYGEIVYVQIVNHAEYPFSNSWAITECLNVNIQLITDFPKPIVSPNENGSITHLNDVVIESSCLNGDFNPSKILRTWEITNEIGETDVCTQEISLEPISLSAISIDQHIETDCTGASNIGNVQINFGTDLYSSTLDNTNNSPCNISIIYEDTTIGNECDKKQTLRNWTLMDFCSGETINIAQLIEYKDETGPEIRENIVFEVTEEPCQFPNLSFEDFEIFDLCSDVESATMHRVTDTNQNYNIINGLESFPFNIGSNHLSIEATDFCGNTSQNIANIVMQDKAAPKFSEIINLELDETTCLSSEFKLTDLDIIECSEIVEAQLVLNQDAQMDVIDLLSGNNFPTFIPGETFVEVTVTDAFGNKTVKEVKIEVLDNTLPVIPNEFVFSVEANSCAIEGVSLNDLMISDACSELASVIATNQTNDQDSFDLLNGDQIPTLDLGVHSFDITAVDDFENETVQTITISVEDNIPAEAVCKNVALQLQNNIDNVLSAEELDGGSFDNCANLLALELKKQGEDMDWTSSYLLESSDIGINFFDILATFDNGEVASCTAKVNVFPPPMIPIAKEETLMHVENISNGSIGERSSTPISNAKFDVGDIYPNPMDKVAHVDIQSKINASADLSLYNIEGKLIFSSTEKIIIGFNKVNIQLQNKLPSGIYFFSLSVEDFSLSKKIEVF